MITGIIKVDVRKCCQPKPKAEADNTNRDLNYSGYHKNRIVLLYIVLKKITTNALSQRST